MVRVMRSGGSEVFSRGRMEGVVVMVVKDARIMIINEEYNFRVREVLGERICIAKA